MQQLKCISRIGLFMFCVVIFLAGCSATALTPKSDSITVHVPSITPNALGGQQTQTAQVATPLTISPSDPIASSSVTPTVTPAISSPETPTITIPPTLPPEEAKAFVLALTESNGGCLLPCFWGFVPGETAWQIAEPQLTTFAYQIYYGTPDGTFSKASIYLRFTPLSSSILRSNINVPTVLYACKATDSAISEFISKFIPLEKGLGKKRKRFSSLLFCRDTRWPNSVSVELLEQLIVN